MKKVFISMACVLIALSGCTNGGSNKESMEVVLNIKRKVKPECVSALKESFLKCKESTLLEPGCIDYGMYQSLTDSTEFFIAETWKNDGELQKHGETAHLKQHLNEIKDMGDPSYKGSFRKIYVPIFNYKRSDANSDNSLRSPFIKLIWANKSCPFILSII